MRSGRLIGACDLSLIERHVVDLGYMLGPAHWGKGFATEIALALIDAAFSNCAPNASSRPSTSTTSASIRVLEKIGMRWEAVFRKHRRAKNRWWDCHLYVLPRAVWDGIRADSLLRVIPSAASCSGARAGRAPGPLVRHAGPGAAAQHQQAADARRRRPARG